jgi:aminopeptidase N
VFFAQSYGWYPGYDDDEFTFATRSNFELTLRVPRKYQAVATGKKFEEAVEGDWLRTRWQSEIPLAVAGFAYGGYEVQIQQVGKVQVEVYANKNPDDLLRTIEVIADDTMPEQNRRINPLSGLGSLSPARLRKEMVTEMANAVQFFQKSFGPYPFEKLAMANIPSWYAYGQGWPGLIYLSAISFLDPVQRTQLGLGGFEGELTDRWRSHEIAHNWWGHAVSWQSYHDQWLSEGFAEYSALLYTFVRRGPDEFFKTLRWNRDQLLHKDRYGVVHEQIGPIYAGWRLTSARHNYGYRYVVYMKGAWVLHMIRMMLFDTNNPKDPDHRFVAMMQEFTKTYYNKPAATEDFKRIVEKHMTPQMDMDGNRRMDWFFNQWVYGTGIPQYRLAYSIEPGQQPNTFTLKGRLIQAGVPPTFKMPVPLYFTKGKNTILAGWIPAVGPETPFEVPISFKPDKVTLNESEDILSIPPK